MILQLNQESSSVDRTKKVTLKDIGWQEIHLQELMYNNLDALLPDDELLLIMQSKRWQEEPDLMAVDKEGTLFIFELKAWESSDVNLLQVFRYGQKFGQRDYESLNRLYKKRFPDAEGLIESLNQKFGIQLKEEQVNQKQKFILITNGLDFKTRQAIQYWRGLGIDVDGWIYRLHKIKEHVLLEFETFRKSDNPFEDLEGGYYILNTNIKDGMQDDEDMLKNEKAAAFFTPWKHKITQIDKGDKVFLYRSGVGIVAAGIGSGKLEKKDYRDNPGHHEEEFFTRLSSFKILKTPLTAREVKELTEVDYRFMSTMFSIDKESGKKIWDYIIQNNV